MPGSEVSPSEITAKAFLHVSVGHVGSRLLVLHHLIVPIPEKAKLLYETLRCVSSET